MAASDTKLHDMSIVRTESPGNSEKTRYGYYLVITAVFWIMAQSTWCRFGNLIVDTFRDQIAADKLAHGAILYKDVYYLFGLLPPYILAFLNKAFGTSLYCSIWFGLCMVGACCFFIYRICRFYLSRLFSTLAVINFLCVFAFNDLQGNGLFNYLLPYSVASYVAIAGIMAAVFFFIRFMLKGYRRDLALWAVASYLTFLSRIYIAIPAYAVFLLAGVALERRRLKHSAFLLFSPALAAVTTYAVYFISSGAWPAFQESVLRMFVYECTSNPLARFNMGMADVTATGRMVSVSGHNVLNIIQVFAEQTVTMVLLYLGGKEFSRLKNKSGAARGWPATVASYAVYAVLSLGVCFLFWPLDSSIEHITFTSILMSRLGYGNLHHLSLLELTYISTPLILAVVVFVSLRALLRTTGSEARMHASVLLLSSLALLLVSRTLFRVMPYTNGNYLLLPSIGVIIYYFVVLIPRVIDARWIGEADRSYYYLGVALYCLIIASGFAIENIRVASFKTHAETHQGSILRTYHNNVISCVWETTRYLAVHTPPDATVLVLPEGFSLNYFARRTAPMRYDNYLPNILNTVGEEKIVREMNAARIDYVVIVHRLAYEYGAPRFGIDYGREIAAWVNNRYELTKTIGNEPFGNRAVFGTAIYKRKVTAHDPA